MGADRRRLDQPGPCTFFGLPMAADAQGRPPDVVLGGIAPGRDGGNFMDPGVQQVRQVSESWGRFHGVHQLDVFERVQAVDGGNAPAARDDRVAGWARRISRGGSALFAVGGDPKAWLAGLEALTDRHGELALLHVDAFSRAREGEFIRQALHENLVEPQRVVQVGIRSPVEDADEEARVRTLGGVTWSMDDWMDRGPDTLAEVGRARLQERPAAWVIHLSALEPGLVPGVTQPAPGGLFPRELLRFMRNMIGLSPVGLFIGGWNGSLDPNFTSASLVAQILFEGLALRAATR